MICNTLLHIKYKLKRLKDDQSKAIVITYLLGTLPMDLQKFIAEQQLRI
nr:MAG TPA: hypothetical protein [Caudoviricetes sp.]